MPPVNGCSGGGQPLEEGAVGYEGFPVPDGRSTKGPRSDELALGSLCWNHSLVRKGGEIQHV